MILKKICVDSIFVNARVDRSADRLTFTLLNITGVLLNRHIESTTDNNIRVRSVVPVQDGGQEARTGAPAHDTRVRSDALT